MSLNETGINEIDRLLVELNDPRNYIVSRFVYDIPSETPMRIVDLFWRTSEFGERIITLLIDGEGVNFRDYSNGEMFHLAIRTSYDDAGFYKRLGKVLAFEGETFITLETTKYRGNNNPIPVWKFSQKSPLPPLPDTIQNHHNILTE